METGSAGQGWMEERKWGDPYSSCIVKPQKKSKK
jgi:hypothetical protein